jgi:hypothetical protein
MIVRTAKGDFQVEFKTDKNSIAHDDGSRKVITVCEILQITQDSDSVLPPITGVGFASQNYRDAHVRRIGRKVALARALADAKIEKNYRRLFWLEFNNGKF